LRSPVTATADDGQDVAVEKPEGSGQNTAEIGDGEKGKRNADDSVQHRHDHPS